MLPKNDFQLGMFLAARCLLLAAFGILPLIFGIDACVGESEAKPPIVAMHDASLASPRKLGVTFIEAGVDSGSISEGGLLTFTLTTPVSPPMGDPPITAIEIRGISMDLAGGTYTVFFGTQGGDPQKVRQVVGQLGAAQELTFTNAIKALIASTYGVTFQ